MLFRKFSGAFLAAAVVLGAAFTVHRAAASQGERRGSREQWEHCALVINGAAVIDGERRSGLASLCHFRGGTAKCEEIRVPITTVRGGIIPSEAGQMQTTASVISRLGAEGWQLVEVGAANAFGVSGDANAFYFKRAVN